MFYPECMVAADSRHAFLRMLLPHDQITYWIGAIMREAAQLELTCALMTKAIVQGDVAERESLDSRPDLSLGNVATKLPSLLEREDIRGVAPELAQEILGWSEAKLSNLNLRRNRIAHDVVTGDGRGTGAVRFGSSQVFSHEEREPVTEVSLIELQHELEQARVEAEDLWSRAHRAWRHGVTE